MPDAPLWQGMLVYADRMEDAGLETHTYRMSAAQVLRRQPSGHPHCGTCWAEYFPVAGFTYDPSGELACGTGDRGETLNATANFDHGSLGRNNVRSEHHLLRTWESVEDE